MYMALHPNVTEIAVQCIHKKLHEDMTTDDVILSALPLAVRVSQPVSISIL